MTDYRKVFEYIESGNSVTDASKQFSISYSTLYKHWYCYSNCFKNYDIYSNMPSDIKFRGNASQIREYATKVLEEMAEQCRNSQNCSGAASENENFGVPDQHKNESTEVPQNDGVNIVDGVWVYDSTKKVSKDFHSGGYKPRKRTDSSENNVVIKYVPDYRREINPVEVSTSYEYNKIIFTIDSKKGIITFHNLPEFVGKEHGGDPFYGGDPFSEVSTTTDSFNIDTIQELINFGEALVGIGCYFKNNFGK